MEPTYSELVERVERLEHLVDELRAAKARPVSPPTPAVSTRAAAPVATPLPRRARAPGTDLRTLLRFIGIALLLFGVVFLFKFSDNEGTFIRTLRVVIGVALGTALVVVGRVLLARDRAFAQVLTGGGIGVWYISGFAAHQLFGLVPAAPAFAYMTVVTLLAFVISLRQGSPALTIVATLGGLATPYLLHDPDRSVLGVVVYVVLVTTGAVAIHARRRWSALLWVAACASGTALLVARFQYSFDVDIRERWILQAGILYLWAIFACATVASFIRSLPARARAEEVDSELLLAFMAPVYLVATTALVWNLDDAQVGRMCLAVAIVYAIATVRFFPVLAWGRLTSAHFLVASGAATTGALLLIDGDAQHLAVATEALVLRLFARKTKLYIANVVSHALFAIVALLLLRDLEAGTRPLLPLNNRLGVTTLWSLLCILGAAYAMPPSNVRRWYVYAGHALSLGWILHQFSLTPNGQVIVTVIWGLDGATLMVVGLRRSIRYLRTLGLLTLLAVVAKLFIVDLRSVAAIWRILLFIGFGGVFLALSYWFMSLDRSRSEATKPPDAALQ